MIRANVTKFGQNFIVYLNFFWPPLCQGLHLFRCGNPSILPSGKSVFLRVFVIKTFELDSKL